MEVQCLVSAVDGPLPDLRAVEEYFEDLHWGWGVRGDRVERDSYLLTILTQPPLLFPFGLDADFEDLEDVRQPDFQKRHYVDGQRVEVDVVLPDIYGCRVTVRDRHVQVNVGHDVIDRISHDTLWRDIFLDNFSIFRADAVSVCFVSTGQIVITYTPFTVRFWKWQPELLILHLLVGLLSPHRALFPAGPLPVRERSLERCSSTSVPRLSSPDGHCDALIKIDKSLTSKDAFLRKVRTTYPGLQLIYDADQLTLTLSGGEDEVTKASKDILNYVSNVCEQYLPLTEVQVMIMGNTDAQNCFQQSLDRRGIHCSWEFSPSETGDSPDMASAVGGAINNRIGLDWIGRPQSGCLKVVTSDTDPESALRAFSNALECCFTTEELSIDSRLAPYLQSDSWKEFCEDLQMSCENGIEPALKVEGCTVIMCDEASNIYRTRRAVVNFLERCLTGCSPVFMEEEVTEAITCLKPWQTEMVIEAYSRGELETALTETMIVDTEAKTIEVRAPAYCVGDFTILLYQYVFQLRETRTPLSPDSLRLLQGFDCRQRVRRLLEEAGLIYDWQVEGNQLFLRAHNSYFQKLVDIFRAELNSAQKSFPPKVVQKQDQDQQTEEEEEEEDVTVQQQVDERPQQSMGQQTDDIRTEDKQTQTDLTLEDKEEQTDPTQIDQGGQTDPTQIDQGGQTDPTQIDQGGQTDPTQIDQGGQTDPTQIDQGGQTDPTQIDQGGQTDPTQIDQGGQTDMRQEDSEARTQRRQVNAEGQTESTQKDREVQGDNTNFTTEERRTTQTSVKGFSGRTVVRQGTDRVQTQPQISTSSTPTTAVSQPGSIPPHLKPTGSHQHAQTHQVSRNMPIPPPPQSSHRLPEDRNASNSATAPSVKPRMPSSSSAQADPVKPSSQRASNSTTLRPKRTVRFQEAENVRNSATQQQCPCCRIPPNAGPPAPHLLQDPPVIRKVRALPANTSPHSPPDPMQQTHQRSAAVPQVIDSRGGVSSHSSRSSAERHTDPRPHGGHRSHHHKGQQPQRALHGSGTGHADPTGLYPRAEYHPHYNSFQPVHNTTAAAVPSPNAHAGDHSASSSTGGSNSSRSTGGSNSSRSTGGSNGGSTRESSSSIISNDVQLEANGAAIQPPLSQPGEGQSWIATATALCHRLMQVKDDNHKAVMQKIAERKQRQSTQRHGNLPMPAPGPATQLLPAAFSTQTVLQTAQQQLLFTRQLPQQLQELLQEQERERQELLQQQQRESQQLLEQQQQQEQLQKQIKKAARKVQQLMKQEEEEGGLPQQQQQQLQQAQLLLHQKLEEQRQILQQQDYQLQQQQQQLQQQQCQMQQHQPPLPQQQCQLQ